MAGMLPRTTRRAAVRAYREGVSESVPELPPASHFHEPSFWRKLTRFAERIGRGGVRQALTLYHAWRDPDTPPRAKATIAAALAYLVAPLDLVPDVLLGIGYGDDLTALAFAASVVAWHIKPQHRQRAAERVRAWFGPEHEAGASGPNGDDAHDGAVHG